MALKLLKKLLFDRPLKNGVILNHQYKIEECLGMGGYGLVYLCTDILTQTPYVLKQLRPTKAKKEKEKHSPFSFRHFVLGTLAIFFYVGVEVGIANFANLFMTQSVDKGGLAIDTTVAGTIGYWTNNARNIRIANLAVNSPCMLLYDVLVKSWGGALNEAVTLVSIIISIIRFGWKALDGDRIEA